MKIQYWEGGSKCFLQLINDEARVVSSVVIDLKYDEYPRYKEYCNSEKIAKIIRVETNPNHVGKGYASKLIKYAIKKLNDYNLVLLCSPQKRWEDTDTLKTVTDLQMFYSKFGFVKTNELLPTMIKQAKYK
jgi:GNAT superfamily N-acetyltransferase